MPGGPIEYTPITSGSGSTAFGPITLPAAVDNQPVVQVRWVYYWTSGTFSGPQHRSRRVQLDDISITSLPIVTFPAMSSICPSTPTFALNTATPLGGTYSGPGVVANTFNPTAAGLGSHILTYTYTDPFGMTNSAQQTVLVDNSGCTTQLNSTWCGATNVTLGQIIYCDPVPGAQNYEWRFTNAALNYSHTRIKGNNYHSMGLWAITGLQYGQTYNVEVRAMINNQWANFGPVCTITTSTGVPTAQLTGASCGAQNLTLGSVLNCTQIWTATNYQFEFTNQSNNSVIVYTKNNNANSVSLSVVPGIQYGTSYSVRVRAYVYGWGNYGNPCTITMAASAPTTQLTTTYCNATNLTTTSVIYCNPVTNATDFQYNFINTSLNFNDTITKGNNSTSFSLSTVPGLQANATYMVRVRAKVNGVWGAFGNFCNITVGSVVRIAAEPLADNTTELAPEFNAVLYPNPVSGGVSPRVKISGADGEFAVIKIMDNTGRMVASYAMNVSGNEFDAQLNEFPQLSSGIYMLQVIAGDQTSVSKFIVE
ncbi:MAG: hypothetical protein Fur0041_15000 [Bacteroidia bacterium]